MPSIALTTQIAASPAACFEMSLSVDAHAASMEDSGERAVGGVTSGIMGEGDTVTWRARHFGVPITMTSRIAEYQRPHRFVDEQVSGPFRSWWHEHRFEPVDGGTQMTDVVEFESPLGPIGSVANRLLLTRYMTNLLLERNQWLKHELERQARLVKDPDRLSFWGDRVRAFTETKPLGLRHLWSPTPDVRHEWLSVDPLVSHEDWWPIFQAVVEACGDEAFAVVEIPCRRVPSDAAWEWEDDELEVREFSADTTWDEVLEASTESEKIFGPFFTIDRMMVVGSSASWCLIYTEIPDVECWVTIANGAPPHARARLLGMGK